MAKVDDPKRIPISPSNENPARAMQEKRESKRQPISRYAKISKRPAIRQRRQHAYTAADDRP
jgi:hypothetical protein